MATEETVPLAGVDLNSQRTEELLHGILLELKNLNIHLRKQNEAPPLAANGPLSSAAEIAVQAALEVVERAEIQIEKVEEERQGDSEFNRSSPSVVGSPTQKLDLRPIESDIEVVEKDQDDVYTYHWQFPVHIQGQADILEKPSQAICDEWSQAMPRWGIPSDGRLCLSFETNILQQAYIREPAEAISSLLRTQEVTKCLSRYDERHRRILVVDYFDDGSSVICLSDPAATRPQECVPRTINKPLLKGEKLYSAPWRRIIEIYGLAATLPAETNIVEAMPWISTKHFYKIHNILTAHIKCSRKPQRGLKFPLTDSIYFHIAYYEVKKAWGNGQIEGKLWKAGRLHSDPFYHRSLKSNDRMLDHKKISSNRECQYLQRSSTSVIAFSYSPKYWTVLALMPEGDNDQHIYPKNHSPTAHLECSEQEDDHNVIAVILVVILQGIVALRGRLDELQAHFEQVISSRDALLDPEQHDKLLTDDDNFSRSKTYFWSINLLSEIVLSIEDNIAEFESCTQRWEKSLPFAWSMKNSEISRMIVAVRKKTLPFVDELRARQKRFIDLSNEAKALRDGLFSASSVMESRASTRLGENVRLLTYVTIFFLPLSFCMSIWSINNTLFSLRSLVITAVIIALTTYYIVFNVEGLVALYSTSKSGLGRWWKALKSNTPRKVEDTVKNKEKDETKRMRFWKTPRTEDNSTAATTTV